jgi:hypothetical protein
LSRRLVLLACLLAGAVLLPAGGAVARWSLPSTAVSPSGQVAYNPSVAIGPDGRTTVVWQVENGFADLISTASRQGNAAFGAPATLSGGSDNSTPLVATGPDGSTVSVWTRANGGNSQVDATVRAPGGASFLPSFGLSSASSATPYPSLAVGPGGQATVAWVAASLSGDRIQVRTRLNASDTFGPVQLPSDAGQDAAFPQVAIGPDGTNVVVWSRSNGSNDVIQATTRDGGLDGPFPAAQTLSDPTASANNPVVAIGPQGETVVVWQSGGIGGGIWASVRESGNGPFPSPVRISSLDPANVNPQVAIGPDGQITVVWSFLTFGVSSARSATRAAEASAFSDPVPVPGSFPGSLFSPGPQVATGADGTTTIALRYFQDMIGGPGPSIRATVRKKGATSFSSPVTLSGPGEDAGYPRLSTGGDGRTTVVWPDSTDNRIRSATRLPDPSLAKPIIKGPAKAKRGRKATYRVRIRNVGFGAANGLAIRVNGRGVKVSRKAGSLAGRKSKTVKVPVRFSRSGKVKVTFTVTAKNAGKKSVTKVVRVG